MNNILQPVDMLVWIAIIFVDIYPWLIALVLLKTLEKIVKAAFPFLEW